MIAQYDTLVTNKEGEVSSTVEVDLAKATKDSKRQDYDSLSLYQVNNFITYSNNEKCIMCN